MKRAEVKKEHESHNDLVEASLIVLTLSLGVVMYFVFNNLF